MKLPIRSIVITCFMLFILGITSTVQAQVLVTKYTVGTIPNYDHFQVMTADELDQDTTQYNQDNDLLIKMLNGTAFIQGVTESEKKDAISYQETLVSQRYRDNRSRYFMDLSVNNKQDNSRFAKVDTLTSRCDAYLVDGSIRLGMGVWGMGGFSFMLDINKVNFTSAYWEDAHQHPIYKKSLNDKEWEDNVLVDMAQQSLILKYRPSFVLGEEISGCFTFKTKDYYRLKSQNSENSKQTSKDETMDNLTLTGTIFFKCKVRKKTAEDDE